MAVSSLLSKGALFRLVATAVVMLSMMSCATTYLAGTQSVDPEADNVTFMDDVPVYTSVIESSVVEFQFVPRETNWGRDFVGEPIQGSFFLQNLSEENLDYRPSDVWLIVWAEGESSAEGAGGLVAVYVYRGVDDIASYVAEIAKESSRPDYVNTTGGVYTYLYGGTIGESIIASNQTRAANAAARRDAQARRAQVSEKLDEFLLGRTTVEPGAIITGGVGFTGVTFLTQAIVAPSGPVTEELIQGWRGGFYGVEVADSLEPGTPVLEQIIANPETREAIQARSKSMWAEMDTEFALTEFALPGPALRSLYPRQFARIDAITGLLLLENESGTHRVPISLDVHAVNGDAATPVSFPYTPWTKSVSLLPSLSIEGSSSPGRLEYGVHDVLWSSVARIVADDSSKINILIDFDPEAESFDNLMNVTDLLDMRFDFYNRYRSFRTELREKHDDIPWRRIIALRNRRIHDYMGINFNIVVIATRIRFVRRIRCGS